jgi:hypothetical protein
MGTRWRSSPISYHALYSGRRLASEHQTEPVETGSGRRPPLMRGEGGRLIRILYALPAGSTPQDAGGYYENALRQANGEVLFSGAQDQLEWQ